MITVCTCNSTKILIVYCSTSCITGATSYGKSHDGIHAFWGKLSIWPGMCTSDLYLQYLYILTVNYYSTSMHWVSKMTHSNKAPGNNLTTNLIISYPTSGNGIIFWLKTIIKEILLELAELGLQKQPADILMLAISQHGIMVHILWLLSQSSPWKYIIHCTIL